MTTPAGAAVLVRLVFVLAIALAMQHLALLEFRPGGAGHWAWHDVVLKEAPRPPPSGIELPLTIAHAPPVAVIERREPMRTRAAWCAGAVALVPVSIAQWLASNDAFPLEAISLLFRVARH